MEVLVCLLVGYACGNLLTAELVARRELGRSAFDVGVGNPGMANMGHELGLRAAALTLAGDLGKVVVATVVCSLAFPQLGSAAAAWAGLGCTLGHNFPAWHRFRGGKGVATTCATIVLASPGWGIASLLVGLAAVVLSGYLCVGAITIAASYALLMLLAGDLAHAVVALALLALMVLAHGSAVAGIRDGSTPRASLAEKVRSLLPFDLPGAPAHAGAAHAAGAHAGAGVRAAADKDPGSRRPSAGAGAPGRSASGGFFTRGSLSLDALLHGSPTGDDAARRVRSRVGKVSPGDTLAYPRAAGDAPSADATTGPASFSPAASDVTPGPASFSPAAAAPEASAAGEVAPVAASPQQAAPAIPSVPTQAAPAEDPFAPGAPAQGAPAQGAPAQGAPEQATNAPVQATVAVDKTVAMPRVVAAPAAGGPATPSEATRRRIRTEAADMAPHVRQDATTRRAQVVRAQATDQVRPMIPAIEAQRMASQQRLHHEQQAAAEEIVRIGHFVGEGARAAGKGLAQAGSAAARALGRAQAASADELERRRTLERRRASAASRDGSLTQRPSTEGHGRGPRGSRTPLEHTSRPRPAQDQGARQGREQQQNRGQRQGQATRATRSQRPQVGRGPVRDARPSRAPRAPQPTAEHARPKHARYPEQGQGSHGSQDARHPQQHEAHQAHAPRHRS